jgi:hypothetical protein
MYDEEHTNMEEIDVSPEAYEYIEDIRQRWSEIADPIDYNQTVVLMLHELTPLAGLTL